MRQKMCQLQNDCIVMIIGKCQLMPASLFLSPHQSDSWLDWQGEELALGAAVAALGLSNKAIYARKSQLDGNATGSADPDMGGYSDGPDLAPNAAPSATAGVLC